jgi:hypothetical protein
VKGCPRKTSIIITMMRNTNRATLKQNVDFPNDTDNLYMWLSLGLKVTVHNAELQHL